MIHVTTGHLESIGPEVFLKSYLLLSKKERDQLVFHCSKSWLETYQKKAQLHFPLLPKLFEVDESSKLPASTVSLLSALNQIEPSDILVTLPTSKDQLLFNQTQCTGYTNFFREYFCDHHISMIFKSSDELVALLTDHIPLREVSKISSAFVLEKVSRILQGMKQIQEDPREVLIAGINPHAGEKGLLGHEDQVVTDAIHELQSRFPNISFKGPLPGDTLHFEHSLDRNQMKVYAFHDQALAPFKLKSGMMGINITLGLPFVRMSVDHGTAFHLFGKGQANPMGCLYVLKKALELNKRK